MTMMMVGTVRSFLFAALAIVSVSGFSIAPHGPTTLTVTRTHTSRLEASSSSSSPDTDKDVLSATFCSRRTMLAGLTSAVLLGQASAANAMPMVKTTEFNTILKESGRGVQMVEFSGSKNEVVTVKLMDGTKFGVSDVIESSTDPRSPLALAATCREYNVPTKFVQLDAILASTSTNKKKKNYANSAVREAAEKEKVKQERMKLEEEARLRALYDMEVKEAQATVPEVKTE